MGYADIKTTEEKIEYCLKEFPETRNSDKALIIKVWQLFHGDRIIAVFQGQAILLQDLYDIPSQDDAKRIRAKFNHLGRYWPTDEKVAKKRLINMDEWRIALGYPPINAPKKSIYFEVGQKVIAVPEEEVAGFLALNPRAVKLS